MSDDNDDTHPAEAPGRPLPARRKRCILVVDDEAVIVDLVGMLLAPLDCEVLAAGSGQEALELAQREPESFDALLTDLRLPDTDGLSLARQLRQRRPGLPCLLMTGYGGEALQELGAQPDEVQLLAKPFKNKQLRDLVARALGLPPP